MTQITSLRLGAVTSSPGNQLSSLHEEKRKYTYTGEKVITMRHFILVGLIAVGCVLFTAGSASSQIGPSFSLDYDILPYQGIDEPIVMEDGSLVDDAEVKLTRFRAAFSYPVVLSQGRTILVNELSHQQIRFSYRKTTSLLDRLYSVGYSLSVMHSISERWSVLAMGRSSLASDLEVDVNTEDFSFQTAVIFNRRFNQGLSMGLGAAYSTQFGSGDVIPLLSIDWSNGAKWSAKAILPSSLEVWYDLSRRVNIGLLVTGDGDNFRFDPGSYRATHPEPNLRYTMMTIGSIARIHLFDHLSMSVEAGTIGLHRFEFYSGDQEIVSNDLKSSQYVRLGLQSNL